jgi:hypothetical protein
VKYKFSWKRQAIYTNLKQKFLKIFIYIESYVNIEGSFSCNLYCIVAMKNDEKISIIFAICVVCVFPCDVGKVVIYLNLLNTHSGCRTFLLYIVIHHRNGFGSLKI